MERYKVNISEPSENDLIDIARYISDQVLAPITAIEMIETIEKVLDNLSYMPYKYPLVADRHLSAMGYRKLPIKNYIAFFTIDEKSKTVHIERILYARRDWLNVL